MYVVGVSSCGRGDMSQPAPFWQKCREETQTRDRLVTKFPPEDHTTVPQSRRAQFLASATEAYGRKCSSVAPGR